jgi:hypothetical protein
VKVVVVARSPSAALFRENVAFAATGISLHRGRAVDIRCATRYIDKGTPPVRRLDLFAKIS